MTDEKQPKDNLWTKYWLNPWFGGFVLSALASTVSFFQIDSYFADKHHLNGIFGFLGIGIVLALLAIWFIKKTNDTSTGRGG
jgi:hypothetical protein